MMTQDPPRHKALDDPDTQEHREVDELLPWYGTRQLSAGDLARVKRHLGRCTVCRGELELLRTLQTTVVHTSAQIPDPSPKGIEQMMARLAQDEQHVKVETSDTQPTLWDRFLQMIQAPLINLQPIAALAVVVIVLQFGVITWLTATRDGGDPRPYTLSAPTGQAETKPRLIIMFHKEARYKDIEVLLQSIQGTIVQGPTAQGAYTVELGQDMLSAEEREQIFGKVQATTNVVTFVAWAD